MDFNFEVKLTLENNRSRLETLDWEHFEHLLPIALAHPTLLKYSPSKFGNEANLRGIFETAISDRKNKTRNAFVIFDKVQNRYVGCTSFGNISNKNLRMEIGWTWLDKAVQRTGLNRNNKFLMLQYAFEVLEFERIELKTDDRNVQSKTAIEGIGGKYEGTLKSHTLMTDGHRRDTVYYGILKADWPGLKDGVFKEFS